MSKYKDVLIVPLYRNMYNPKGGVQVHHHTTLGMEFGSSFLLVILTMMRKPKETNMIRKEFQLVLWSWTSIPVWYQIYVTGKEPCM